MPVNLGKNLEYLKTQESLRSENLTEYYLCKGIFLYVFSTMKDIIQAQSKTGLKFLWELRVLGEHSDTWALGGNSKGTRALKAHKHWST